MKNIKDITISIFAIIGFVAILSSFNNQPEQSTGQGKYQIATSTNSRVDGGVYETIFDTQTGEVISRKLFIQKTYKK